MLLFLLALLTLLPINFGTPPHAIYLSPSQLPLASLSRKNLLNYVRSISIRTSVTPFTSDGSFTSPTGSILSKCHHHQHRSKNHAVSPSPSASQGCDQTCMEPLTSAPFGSPCMCVFPMRVKRLLGVAPYAVFPEVTELAIEVTEGTYLKQSQVTIVGASADIQNLERTVVDINLVPLGERFDNTTAMLTYQRFLHKKVTLNRSLFGDYDVIYIAYPGLPSFPLPGNVPSAGPMGSVGNRQYPFSANFVGKNQKMNRWMLFVIAFSASVFLVACCAAIAVLLRCRKTYKPSDSVGAVSTPPLNKRSGIASTMSSSPSSSTSPSLISVLPLSVLSVKTFTLVELEKATEKFRPTKVLSEGGFGCVYHGALQDGTEVAVKLLTKDNQNGEREFIGEIEMLSRLHHHNLVKLIGKCIEQHTRCLVYELVRNGSVDSHLHGADWSKGPIKWDARLKIALGAARGLAYLHEDSNPRVIHRDFKASNVLLEDDFTPKVADFGLAREATEGSHHISTRVMGTFGYVAPEYAMTGDLLVKSDVYSYGVVLLELLSGWKPVDMSQPPGQENLVTWARPLLTNREGLQQLVDPALAGTYDFGDMAKVAAIASMCAHQEVAHRPFMGEVVKALKLIYNDADGTCSDACSLKESSGRDSDFRANFAPSDSSWWNAGGITPRLTYGQASSFITMEYSSGPLEELQTGRPFTAEDSIAWQQIRPSEDIEE